MMPIGDDNSDMRTVPYVTYILMAINVIVFVLFQGLGANDNFTLAWSTVPQEIVSGQDIATEARTVTDEASGQRYRVPGLQPTPISVYLTLLTSMFMHGSIAHIFGNMLYLWIFGDNVEDRLGHLRYLAFYLACGVLASLAHVLARWCWAAVCSRPASAHRGPSAPFWARICCCFPNARCWSSS